MARKGMRLHPLALTDFRQTLGGTSIGFKEEDPEGTMVPDLTTFRRLPWQPKLARVLCYYYDSDTGELQDHDARGTLARHAHAFHSEVGAGMYVGIEPELMWLRKKPDGGLEHTTNPLAFYEMAYLEELEPILLDLIKYGRAMGLRITHADAEDASQIEINQAPNFALDYVDDFYTYRQLCRIVARKHGLIATFMAKPFMGVSANGHHHNLSLVDDAGENVLVGDLKGDCRLSATGVDFLGGLIDHADALHADRRADRQLLQALLGRRAVGAVPQVVRVQQPLVPVPHLGRRPPRGARARRLLQPVPDRRVVPRRRARRHPPHSSIPATPVQDNRMNDITIPREERIPITLTEAIEAFKADDLMNELFAPKMYETFVGLRQDDLDRYWSHVSQWELDFYLERWP